MRTCYVAQEIDDFLSSEAATRPDRGTLSPAQQLASALDAFVTGEHIAWLQHAVAEPPFRKLKPREPTGHNVWEYRPTDVRAFGWFCRDKNTFVALFATLKKDLLGDELLSLDEKYDAKIQTVVACRNALGLEHTVWKGIDYDLPLHLKC